MSQLPTIVSFWHGPLGWLERLSIASFVKQGHPYRLYTYGPVDDLPEGAVRLDAAEVVSEDRMFFYKGKHTPAVFADLFRLELMRQEAGLWADCDVVALRPFAGLGDYVFGFEIAPKDSPTGSVNNAVFGCPPDSELLEKLLAIFDPENRDMALPWLPPVRRLEVALRRFIGQHPAPSDIQFGATGPFPLTWYIRELGLMDKVQPTDVFYPAPYTAIPTLMQPGSRVDHYITAQTLGLHIWRSQLTHRGRAALPTPPPNSALAELCAQFGIQIDF